MEVVLQPTDPSDTPAVGVQRAKPSLVSVPLSGTCVAGETVAVDLQLTNPLALPLECGFMRLLVDHWEGTPGGLGTQEVGGSDDVLGRPLADRVEVRCESLAALGHNPCHMRQHAVIQYGDTLR